MAERIAGDHAEVVNLTQPGREPHDLELTVRETAEITTADLVLHEEGFQPAVDAGVEQNAEGDVLEVSSVVDLATAPGSDNTDPHFWQDPLRMAALGDAIAQRLSKVDPGHIDDYSANAADLRTELEALDAAYVDGLTGCERTTVVVSHDAFSYLEKYGLVMESVAGLSPGAEPTPADLGDLQTLIRDSGITTVFSERLVSPELTQTLADDLGITTEVLDPIEGLSDDTADEDYLSLMRQNLDQLRAANGCP